MKTLDEIIDQYLPSAHALSEQIRRLIVGIKNAGKDGYNFVVRRVRHILNENIVRISTEIRRPLLSSWINPAYDAAKESHASMGTIPPVRSITLAGFGGSEPEYLFHRHGLEWLHEQRVVPSWMLPQLDAAAQRSAEFIAHATTEQTAKIISSALQENIQQHGTLKGLKQVLDVAFSQSPLAVNQIETSYRTNGGRAFAAGQQFVLSNPIVGAEFPYVLYSATHDSRTEPTHLMMEHLGLDGTAVYRADDPVIRKFWAPWRWNCRCHCIPISVADAARHGCREAKKWEESGNPPAVPQFVKHPPFDIPKGWKPVNGWQFPAPIV